MKDKQNFEQDERLMRMLSTLRATPVRDPESARRGRKDFQRLVDSMHRLHESGVSTTHEPVPARVHHWGLAGLLFSLQSRMHYTLEIGLAMVLAVAVVLTGTGITVYMAQKSLPDQKLYQVKVWSEDALLSLATSSQVRLAYGLDFTDRRIAEMSALLMLGNPVPASVVNRLQEELEQSLTLAASTNNSQIHWHLVEIHQHASAQLEVMDSLVTTAQESDLPALMQVRDRLAEQVHLATLGETDPEEFRQQIQVRQQELIPTDWGILIPPEKTETPTPTPDGIFNGLP